MIIDRLVSDVEKRLGAYKNVCDLFGFLHSLTTQSNDDLRQSARKLVVEYSNDLEDILPDELILFKEFIKNRVAIGPTDNTELNMYQLLSQERALSAVFPNVHIMLRIYLCMPVSNCSCERSFSKLKLIKNELRSSLCTERLNALSLLSIEHEMVQHTDFNDVIREFAVRKARKVCIVP
jgi:hypothetical protein